MDPSAIIVPMRCEALVVNAGVKDPFRIWQFEYVNLGDFKSPEPWPAETNDRLQDPGVYLHWTLPDAFRSGRQQASGGIDYPLVPNRWLVLRLAGGDTRTAKAIIVESDCPYVAGMQGDSPSASPYLIDDKVTSLWANSADPQRRAWKKLGRPDNPAVAHLGVQFPLAAWNERAAGDMFLTAIAPGNPAFSGYFYHHQNIFGIHDDLADVTGDATLSYYVVGWCSDPAQDPAAGCVSADDYSKLLTRLNWTVAGDDTPSFGRALCTGACFSIGWQSGSAAPAPTPDPLNPDQADPDAGRAFLGFGAGNTMVDAFAALTSLKVDDPAMTTLLRAFSADQLDRLNQPNGPALLDQALRRDWFGSSEGGTRWTIADGSSGGSVAADLTPAESAWLQQLNDDQATLDDLLADLYAMQWAVHALWFKYNYLSDPDNFPVEPPDGAPDPSAILAQLDPDTPGTAMQQLAAQLDAVRAALARVPQPDWTGTTNRSEAFAAGIADFAAKQNLSQGKQLKAVPASPFWNPANPMVVISGVKPAYGPDPSAKTEVRLPGRICSAVSVAGQPVSRSSAAAAFASLPALGALPDGVAGLVDELFLLDPANTASLAAAASISAADLGPILENHPAAAFVGTLPAFDLGAWTQPWSPLFMEWAGDFLPIDGSGAASANWSFDGTDYAFTGAGPGDDSQPVAGRSLLSPHAQFLIGSRLQSFLDRFAADNPELQHIYDQITDIYEWEFLAQELVGFGETLTGRDVRPYRRPLRTDTVGAAARSLPDLLGYDDADAGPDALPPAMRGRVGTVPLFPNPPRPFQGIRQGQFYFTDLYLYDRFGRKLILVSSVTHSGLHDYKSFRVAIDPALQPAHSLDQNVQSVFELPPRILQPMRLDAQFVDKSDDGKLLSRAPDACPVCAWLVANHLDNSLLLFGPDGSSWGEVRLVVGADGITRTAQWAPPPHGNIGSLDEIAQASPQLGAMLASSQFLSEAGFTAFLSAIDSSLWTVDPLGGRADQNLSVLIGRPLALVRLRLQLQLQGQPRRDTGWPATLATDPPDFLQQQFAIRLGDQATRQDGTIGYFTADPAAPAGQDPAKTDYDRFNSVAAPDTEAVQAYVGQVGPPGPGGGQNYPSLPLTDGSYCYLTLLLDPRASVHAATGILPVQPITLPARFIDSALSNMEMSFRMGPLLTLVQPTPAQGGVTPDFAESIVWPMPTERNGNWSWWEKGPDGPGGYDLIAATNNAQLLPPANTLREGTLTFVADLAKKG